MKVIIVTGMSGSGKSKALAFMEDNGYYCLDNLPAKLLPEFVDMIGQMDNFSQKLCVTIDVRNADVAEVASSAIARIRERADLRIIFLDCEESVLLKRYKESRRLHPLMMFDDTLDLVSSIEAERHLLEDIRQQADFVIDTSLLAVADLREKLLGALPGFDAAKMNINFVAFGYKYGIPSDCDLVFDVRCLPNPFYVEELKAKTGRDKEVQDYVMSKPESQELYRKITDYLDCALPMYEHEGKAQLVVGLGCTGGQHRSLTFALMLADKYRQLGYNALAASRDSRREIKSYK